MMRWLISAMDARASRGIQAYAHRRDHRLFATCSLREVQSPRVVIRIDSASIVGDANEIDTTFLDREFNAGRSRIDAILEHLLHHAGRRSITSPAAILLMKLVGSCRIVGIAIFRERTEEIKGATMVASLWIMYFVSRSIVSSK